MTRTRVQIDLDYGQAPAAVGLHFRLARDGDSSPEETSLALVGTNNRVNAADLLYAWMMLGVRAISASGYTVERSDINAFLELAAKIQP